MSKHFVIVAFVLCGSAFGEPPSSLYGPPSPPASYLPAHHSSDLSAARHSSGYQAIGGGWQESEGANLDSSLLHKIEEILLDEENKVASSNDRRSHLSGSYLHSHSLPNPRIVGIQLGYVSQGLQAAQFHQSAHVPSTTYESLSSYSSPSASYGPPALSSHSSHTASSPSFSLSPPSLHSTYFPPQLKPSSTYSAPTTAQIIYIIQPRHTSTRFSTPNTVYLPPSPSYGLPRY